MTSDRTSKLKEKVEIQVINLVVSVIRAHFDGVSQNQTQSYHGRQSKFIFLLLY